MSTQITVETVPQISHNQIPIITTELLAQLYGTEVTNIRKNHSRNHERFVIGKHYFLLEGAELREFKHRVSLSRSVTIARNVRSLILWTERGAARHAKMLETDLA
ncbi:ORF6N domain-containing protein [Escherichia coli]|nr:ORF6N domain-containing protein [Escherichia coli]ELJ9860446.1 ORF6N domain-containing protein [Escherichia coli]